MGKRLRSRPGEPLTDAELRAWQGLLRTSFRLRRDMGEALAREHDLSMADYDVLVRLADGAHGALRMADLADAVLQPRSSLTRIVDGLEQRGLVRRERTDDDGRGQRAVLTAAGREAFTRAQGTHLDNVRRAFLDRVSAEQMRELAAIWAAVEEPG
jgi:DNA-binding MarR family transcriptional regulator